MAKEIAVGTPVMDESGSEYIYAGVNEHGPGWFGIKMSLLDRVTRVSCDAERVIPVQYATEPNVKDSRITVGNYKEAKPRNAAGPWQASIPLADGGDWGGWFKTKKAALAECAMRLQIMDWHAGK